MKKYSLTAQPRSVVGRKVKQLRAQGQIPGTVYGKNVKSVSVAVGVAAFDKIYKEAGETGLVELAVGKDLRPVLVHMIQRHPVTNHVLHVEFHQVNLKEKVHTKVPLVLTGDAPAVVGKVGVLLTLIDEVEVEALPTDLPEKLNVDVSKLAEVNQEVNVGDLKVPAGVTVLTAKDQSVVRVGALISKEAEAEAAAEAAAAAAAAAEAAAAATPAAGAPPAGAPEAGAPAAEKPPPAGGPVETTPKASK